MQRKICGSLDRQRNALWACDDKQVNLLYIFEPSKFFFFKLHFLMIHLIRLKVRIQCLKNISDRVWRILKVLQKRFILYQSCNTLKLRLHSKKKFHIFQHTFNPTVYANLRGIISIAALNIVLNELNRVNSVGIDISLCDSDVRCTHGLPCIHDIAEYIKEG